MSGNAMGISNIRADGNGIMTLVLFLVFGIAAFVYGFHLLGKKRVIEDIPSSKIGTMATGLVEVSGETLPYSEKELKTPFSGENCVYYTYEVQKSPQSGIGVATTVEKGSSGEFFLLKDETGSVKVNPKDLDKFLRMAPKNVKRIEDPLFKEAYTYFVESAKKPPDWIKNMLGGVNMTIKDDSRYNGLFIIERYLKPHITCYVLGTSVPTASGPVLCKGENIFHISIKSEKEAAREIGRAARSMIEVGAAFIFMSVIMLGMIFS